MREITFRGNKNWNNYFEGWYFKAVDVANDLIVILIPGISSFNEKMSFLQYIIHYKQNTYNGFLDYAIDEFKIENPFRLTFPHGYISKEEIELAFDEFRIHFKLRDFIPLKNTLLSPSIMGFFEYLKMPCYHDIVSLTHKVDGTVSIRGQNIAFSGKGYIEGDRGSNFPEFYIWAQCNHFSSPDTSLFMSVADISTPLFQFLGHIAIFYHNKKEYRFASYLGSKVNVAISPDKKRASVQFKNKKHQLQIEIELKEGNSLIAPMNNNMDFKIKEQVKSNIKICFDDYTDESEFCAAELVNWKNIRFIPI